MLLAAGRCGGAVRTINGLFGRRQFIRPHRPHVAVGRNGVIGARPSSPARSAIPLATLEDRDIAGAGDGIPRADGITEAQYAEYDANYQRWLETTRRDGAEAYEALKTKLLKRTQRGGTFLTLYIFLVVNSVAALCCMLGVGGSYLYLWLLIKDVDARDVEDGGSTRVLDAEEVESRVGRFVSKAFAGYMEALNPRLLVPAALAAAAWLYNQNAEPEVQLGLLEEGCLILGFASYKLALGSEIWDSLKPKAKTAEEIARESRPMLPQLEDVEDVRPDLKDERF